MCGSIACIAAVLVGIDAGWRPLPGGGVEYLVQIEPHMLDTLKSGGAIESDVPPFVRDIRAYKVSVGTAELPQQLPAAAATFTSDPAADPVASRVEPPWPPVEALPPGTAATPGLLPPDADTRPIDVRPTGHIDATAATSKSPSPPRPKAAGEEPTPPRQPAKPWLPLTLTLLALFASLGGNMFLVWIARDFRLRYRALVARIGDVSAE